MDLFEYAKSRTMENESPLASRLRPTKLEEVVGQQHIVGKDKLLYRAIKADKLTSVIFYGPPGTGKTTLAKVIANITSAYFTQINATVAGKRRAGNQQRFPRRTNDLSAWCTGRQRTDACATARCYSSVDNACNLTCNGDTASRLAKRQRQLYGASRGR